MNLKMRAKKLKLDIPAVFLALTKKEVPLIAKVFAGITIAYALSPIDLIPDFIPFLGMLDDFILLPVLIFITVKFIPDEIFNQCRLEAKDLWNNGNPQKWYYAIPIILIWLISLSVLLICII